MQQRTVSGGRGFANRIQNAPSQLTPFFGRRLEIGEITRYLADPNCRLLTLTGAGGVGKTRLALQAASELLASFTDGIWFIPLQPVSSAELLAPVIAAVLGLRLTTSDDPEAQLITYLSDKAALLILDNFEQLLGDGGAEVLSGLLGSALALKLLVTSREALKLREEWCYPVGGMPVPASDDAENAERYDAIRLFLERARRVRGDFSLDRERAGVVRICRLVEGLPLAIELAGSWVGVLTTEAIADEIGRNLKFLQTDLRDVPDRHRSMYAVFGQSWALLTPDERAVFQRMSLFRGGFGREAAEQVAGATLPILAALGRRSLLSVEPDGRYHIHELLRQYAEERLAHVSPEAVIEARDRHCLYYTRFLRDRSAYMNGGQQLRAVAEIDVDLENVRAAWLWAAERRQIPALLDATNSLYLFCQFRGRYAEGAQLWERAVDILDDHALAAYPEAALLLYALGWLSVRLGRLQDARELFTRCWAVYRHLPHPPRYAHVSDPRLGLGLLASLGGAYDEALRLLEQVRQASERDGHHGNLRASDYFLAGIHLAQGRYKVAQRHAQTAYALAEASQDRWFMAYCLHELGHAARALGAFEQARGYYQRSYSLREQFGDPGGMAVALTHLGAVALLQGNLETAEECYQRSLAIYRQIDDRGGLVTTLDGLGQTACVRGQIKLAARYLGNALHIAAEARFIALRLSVSISIAQLLLKVGRAERGLEVLRFVQRDPSTIREARDRLQRLLDAPRRHRGPSSEERVQVHDLAELTAQLRAELADLEVQDQSLAAGLFPQTGMQWLVEPLTLREQELLPLLCAGLSYAAISAKLSISLGTVKAHAHNIYGKLGVRNRVQAAARAVELGLL